jgi:GH24 family phage-related lysozyme (muramidase)
LRLKTEYILIGGGLLLLMVPLTNFKTRLLNKLASFIPSVEGFIPHPKWDVNRYSWGYGTAAPGSTGTISRDQAFADMVSYLMSDYEKLKGRINRTLTVGQWAALLSFAYNLGVGRAYDMVPYINANDDNALADQWREYVHAGGVVNQNLVERRDKELVLWFG